MRESSTRFTIRRKLAGLSCADVGRLLHMTPDRAGELLGERGAFKELDDLRCELRTALNRGPDLRVVHEELAAGVLVDGRAGCAVRWTRIILNAPLRKWGDAIGHSTAWWSKFERDERKASAALARPSLDSFQLATIGEYMKVAALRLGDLFPWAALPLPTGPARAMHDFGETCKRAIDAGHLDGGTK